MNTKNTLIAILLGLMPFFVQAKGLSPETVNGAETIDVETAKKLWLQGVLFIDTRHVAGWNSGRIPGAMHLDVNLAGFESELEKKVEKNQPIVTYCNAFKCHRAAEAAEKMIRMGYSKVYYYRTGFPSWKNAGFPYE